MSSWAKPGVKCVCVNDKWDDYLSNRQSTASNHRVPMKNEVLTISKVREWNGGLYIAFLELNDGLGYSVMNFKPLISQSDDIAMFKAIADGALNPVVPPAVVPPRVVAHQT